MPVSQILSKLTPRRLTRTSSVDSPYEDKQNPLKEYKKFMEEIKRKNPHLSIGAQQRITLERCVKTNED